MKRPLSLVLADAFNRAAHDVFVAPQVHAGFNAAAPTTLQCCAYWCQGFVAGMLDDHVSMPLLERVGIWVRGAFNRYHQAVRRAIAGGGGF